MNAESTGGESRPRRRRALKLGAAIFAAAVLLVAIRQGDADEPNHILGSGVEQLTQPDSTYARQLLEAVRGANGIVCGALDRSFDTGYWSHSLSTVIETDFADQQSVEVAQWIGRRKFDDSVFGVARAGLRSDDACVRRVAARIIGSTRDRTRLAAQLESELGASDPRTRTATLFALGFANRHEAVPAIREKLNDSDRNVRVAAIWALANIGDSTVSPTMISLLEKDNDPVVRSAAAWALGRLHND